MRVPSGDHAGDRSCAPGVFVRLRASPFSAGTVTISPRNSNTARAPVGDMRRCPESSSRPSRSAARVSRRSDDTPNVSLREVLVAGSNRCR